MVPPVHEGTCQGRWLSILGATGSFLVRFVKDIGGIGAASAGYNVRLIKQCAIWKGQDRTLAGHGLGDALGCRSTKIHQQGLESKVNASTNHAQIGEIKCWSRNRRSKCVGGVRRTSTGALSCGNSYEHTQSTAVHLSTRGGSSFAKDWRSIRPWRVHPFPARPIPKMKCE